MNILERWWSTNVLGLEIGFPELDLMKPIFYAPPRACIHAICTGKVGSDSLKFEPFEVQELDDMMLV
jgi:hypothetical protein